MPEVLKGLSFKVKAGNKVGLVGRTGAGKSTISLAIPRIVEAFAGSIESESLSMRAVKNVPKANLFFWYKSIQINV